MATSSGTIPFRNYQTWYTIFGDLSVSRRRPLVVLHGGPGGGHNYMLPLSKLAAATGCPVIFYDQVGCGHATHLRGKGSDFFTIEFFLDELDNLLSHFGIKAAYDLYGHSWGAMLGAEHAIRDRPKGLHHFIFANCPAAVQLWEVEKTKLIDALPSKARDAIYKREATGEDTAEYKEGMRIFNSIHVCRVQPMPADLVATFRNFSDDPTVVEAMCGTSDFHTTGTLDGWSVIDRARQIECSTLILNGRYDMANFLTIQPLLDRIPHSRLVTFQGSGHMPHFDEEQELLSCVKDFLEEDPENTDYLLPSYCAFGEMPTPFSVEVTPRQPMHKIVPKSPQVCCQKPSDHVEYRKWRL